MKKLTVRLDNHDHEILVKECELLKCSQNQLFRELLRSNLTFDIKEQNDLLKEILRLLKIASNNLNQIAKQTHYTSDVESIKKELNKIWQSLKE